MLLKRDDGQRFTILHDGTVVPPQEDGRTAYDAGYRRIAHEREVPAGRARIFETGGEFVLVGREGSQLFAFNAHPLVPGTDPHLVHTQRFTVENGTAGDPKRLQPLPVTIENGWIWVSVERKD